MIDFQKQIFAQAALQYFYFWLSLYGLVTWTAEGKRMPVDPTMIGKENSRG